MGNKSNRVSIKIPCFGDSTSSSLLVIMFFLSVFISLEKVKGLQIIIETKNKTMENVRTIGQKRGR